MDLTLTVEQVAQICHEANRAYSLSIGDLSHNSWDAAPIWQRESAQEGVRSILRDPNKTAEQIHMEWTDFKKKEGWTYGALKAPEKKEHPCIVTWEDLPIAQRLKDELFLSIALVFKDYVPGIPKKAVPMTEESTKPGGRGDSTIENGILTTEGDVVKDAQIVEEVKPKKKKFKVSL